MNMLSREKRPSRDMLLLIGTQCFLVKNHNCYDFYHMLKNVEKCNIIPIRHDVMTL